MWKKIIRNCFLEKDDDLVFKEFNNQVVDYSKINNLYIHIPFCRTTCPYCPYFKVKFTPDKVEIIEQALIREIELHSQHISGKRFDSLYIGGGTPTLMNKGLRKAIELLESLCTIDKIAVETNPDEINDKVLNELEQIGCKLISLGIQDFNQKYLDQIGRNYSFQTACKAIHQVKERKFETINIDLIFAFPGQTLLELDSSLKIAMETGVDQITLYPLFTFPYSTIGKFNHLKKVKLPNASKRRELYYHIYDTLKSNGYKQISVWGFLKDGKIKYSSVTRDYYLGFGPSSATYTGKQFLFNSFSIEHYAKQINQNRLPFSTVMQVSSNLERLFWLYWRFYETVIPLELYSQKFQSDFRVDFKNFIGVLKLMGYTEKSNEEIVLNKKGVHKIHLLQNHFALNYVNQIWSESSINPKPHEIALR